MEAEDPIELMDAQGARSQWLDHHLGFLTYIWGLVLALAVSFHFLGSPIIYHTGVFLMYIGAVIDMIEPNKGTGGIVLDCLGFFIAGFFLFTCILAPGRCA